MFVTMVFVSDQWFVQDFGLYHQFLLTKISVFVRKGTL